MELGTLSKIETMVSAWHEAFVNARKWMDQNKIIVLYAQKRS
jgi:hypothetical protein